MVSSLADFIQQLYSGSIDATSSYFLPTVVLEQTLPAEPLAIGDYAWGDLAPVSSTLADGLCAAITSGTICTPGTIATLALTQMEIVGLSNVTPSTPTVTGSQVSGTFAFGGVTDLPPGVTVPPYLAIQGTFTISLSCCTSADGSTCSGAPAPQEITGTFAAGFVGGVLSMTLDVDAAYSVTATALSFAASEVSFAFQTQSPLICSGPLNTLLQAAFDAGAGQILLDAVNARLGAPATLDALGTLLSDAFPSLAAPPVLAFVVSKLYLHVVDPSSSYYLPERISQATDPVLDPYAAGGWSVPDVGQWYPAAGATICASIGAGVNQLEIQTPGSAVALSLSGIEIAGTSNLMAVAPLTISKPGNLTSMTVLAMVACNAVSTWPHTLTISGDFSLAVACCPTNHPGGTCTGPSTGNVGTGTFSAAFAAATVAVNVTISVSASLDATVEAIYFRADPNVDNPKNIVFDIDIETIPGGDRQAWNNMAEGIFNSSLAVSAIVDTIRAHFAQPVVLDTLSAIVTRAIGSLLADEPDLARRVLTEVKGAA